MLLYQLRLEKRQPRMESQASFSGGYVPNIWAHKTLGYCKIKGSQRKRQL